ncbi:sigma-70 family RNA polymerase sigma factor, partial [Candidatus Daviesbacteria bacterium]|nr:sigma-70 family RNA polymerase sigma factor [Candidatus Daviesbacteria bacterium]
MSTESKAGNSPLQTYLEEVSRYPVLNIDQQRSVFEHLRSGTSLDDLRQDITFAQYLSTEDKRYIYAFQQSQTPDEFAFRCNLGLVVSEARKYPRLSTLDLIQEGNIGLMRAIQRYDPNLGKFTSYARVWIKGSILRAIPDLTRPTHAPSGMRRRLNMLKDIETELEGESGVKPSEEQLRQEIHVRMGLSERSINTIFEVMSFGFVQATSLDRVIGPDSDVDLYNFIGDKRVDVEGEALNNVENEEYKRRKRPSAREAAANMGTSIPTAHRALRRLVEAGLLPFHPKDPRTVDETGLTEHTRRLDALVEETLKGNPKMRNNELVILLADPGRLGVTVSTVTIERSRLRLAEAGKADRRILDK